MECRWSIPGAAAAPLAHLAQTWRPQPASLPAPRTVHLEERQIVRMTVPSKMARDGWLIRDAVRAQLDRLELLRATGLVLTPEQGRLLGEYRKLEGLLSALLPACVDDGRGPDRGAGVVEPPASPLL